MFIAVAGKLSGEKYRDCGYKVWRRSEDKSWEIRKYFSFPKRKRIINRVIGLVMRVMFANTATVTNQHRSKQTCSLTQPLWSMTNQHRTKQTNSLTQAMSPQNCPYNAP